MPTLLQQGQCLILFEGLPLVREFLLTLLLCVLLRLFQDFCFTLLGILQLLCDLITLSGLPFLILVSGLLVWLFFSAASLLLSPILLCLLRFQLLGPGPL